MTCVEFFDKNIAENICTALVCNPDRVIMIGNDSKKLKKHAGRYKELFSLKGQEIEFLCRPVSKNNLDAIVALLCDIVETYDDLVFDLTGGEDLMLVAVGIVYYYYRDKDYWP